MFTAPGPDSLALLSRCLQSGHPQDWEQLVGMLQPLVTAVAYRVARRWHPDVSRELVDDLVQDTFLKIFEHEAKALRHFVPSGPDSLFGFVKVLTANHVHDQLKARIAQSRGGQAIHSDLDDDATASTGHDASVDLRLLYIDIEQALTQSTVGEHSARDRVIFWLYYRHGYTAEAIARIPHFNLTVKGVESTLNRLVRAIRKALVEQGKGIASQGSL